MALRRSPERRLVRGEEADADLADVEISETAGFVGHVARKIPPDEAMPPATRPRVGRPLGALFACSSPEAIGRTRRARVVMVLLSKAALMSAATSVSLLFFSSASVAMLIAMSCISLVIVYGSVR